MRLQAKILDSLNDAQRRGVVHEGSPLIVLAGPGTGKTRLITHRVAHLILERGAAPSSIVAVTFTNKAADELRIRLADLVGSNAADAVEAGTFHSFGLRLMRRFGDLAGLGTRPEIIDSAQRRRLMRRLATEHRVYGPLLALGAEPLLDEAARTIETLRHNAAAPEDALAFAHAWEDRLDRGIGSDGASIDAPAIDAQREELARFEAHASLYRLFEEACRERSWVTLEQLITVPTRLMLEHERVRSICHHEHRHFVVDEFQDVNLSQIEMVRALAPPERAPDLVVVGDDDQAIYEFRGADDRAFARFASIWTDAQTLALTENYRSDPSVLHVANAIIGRASERFAPDKRIERAAALADQTRVQNAGVEIVQLDRDPQAGDAIASMVREEIASAPEEPLSRIAVIARTHNELDAIGEALEIEGVPTQRHKEASILDDPGVQDLLAWIELLVDPQAQWAVRRVLSRPPFSADLRDQSRWEANFAKQRRLAMLGEEDGTPKDDYAAWLAMHAPDHAIVARFSELREELARTARSAPAADLIWTISTRLDLVHADLLGGRDRAARVSRLVRVIDFARTIQARLDQPGDLASFWSYYHDLDPRDQAFGASGEATVETDPEGEGKTENAVQLCSAHGSKGLEFDVVFVPRVNPPHGYPKTAGGTDGIVLPEGMIDRLGDDRDAKTRARAEERRIFYVASTRAERRLVLFTKHTKKRSSTEHYAQELLFDEPELITVHALDEVLASGRDALGETAPPGASRELRRRVADEERRAARGRAAAALDALDHPDADADTLARALAAFQEAGVQTALAAAFDATGRTEPLAPSAHADASVSRLVASVGSASADANSLAMTLAPMSPPIDLSFTMLNQYERCPACFYVRHVLGLGERPSAALSTGTVVHAALEHHAKLWRDAEAEGGARPDADALIAHGRRLLGAQVREGRAWGENDPLRVEELDEMLRQAHAMMVASSAEILEIERRTVMPCEIDGARHRLVAKIDRVDRVEGGVRIIDYKTGAASKKKLEPEPDDLQLGIYAMAIEHDMPGSRGIAEYWMLRTGQRGIIDLADIDREKVHARITDAVTGMTEGRFPRNERTCNGLCELLRIGPVQEPPGPPVEPKPGSRPKHVPEQRVLGPQTVFGFVKDDRRG